MKVFKLRLGLHHSREDLSKLLPDLEEMERTVRSSMAIDRAGVGVGPLPRPTPLYTKTRGTNTELSFAPFFSCHSTSQSQPESWVTLEGDPDSKPYFPPPPPSHISLPSQPSQSVERGSSLRETEWNQLIQRATLFYSPASLNNGTSSRSQTPISFTKILESDLDTTGKTSYYPIYLHQP